MKTRFHLWLARWRVALLAAGAASLLMFTTAATRPRDGGNSDFVELEIAKIYWEYNSSANDLGVHVSLDGEDWKKLEIDDPNHHTIFEVAGKGPYAELGMTELFFESAEPSLDEVPLDELLARFPEGDYVIEGRTVDGEGTGALANFSHAIPAGPEVTVELGSKNFLKISWTEVTSTPPGFPALPIHIVGYQVIVEPSFQVTLPATARSVTVSPEFVESLPAGENKFEVLAIEASGNQTITEGTFTK